MSLEEIIRMKLGLEELTPEARLYSEEVKMKVRLFCNLPDEEEIKPSLAFTMANMVVDLINKDKAETEPDDKLKSIDMGDTSYTFDTANKFGRIDNLLRDYEGDLLKYRRIRK